MENVITMTLKDYLNSDYVNLVSQGEYNLRIEQMSSYSHKSFVWDYVEDVRPFDDGTFFIKTYNGSRGAVETTEVILEPVEGDI